MKRIYQKLVRDGIPGIIEAKEEIPVTRILSNEEYKKELEKSYRKNTMKFLMPLERKGLRNLQI